ncbi:MAG: hypothetical protein KJ787_08965 [Gammaproteobacteria bacterium]|nr:hypothetical protein [Gammaproteobacteria bacterium]MBU1646451.1 hypothetical protein [Gammaproteobacteria bacterium]MBU1970994.1 hypothetical protein [Gammaproteobacteria bacterium]
MNDRLSRFALYAVAAVALIFGLMTIASGGKVLFGGDAARAAAGDYLPFVVWFNFLAGFAYVAAGAGLATGQAWAARLALYIAAATAMAFLVFGLLALTGTPFEWRTVGAMTLRTTLWTAIAWFACSRRGTHCFR